MDFTPYSNFFSSFSKALDNYNSQVKSAETSDGEGASDSCSRENSEPEKFLDKVRIKFINKFIWEDLEAMGNEMLVTKSSL